MVKSSKTIKKLTISILIVLWGAGIILSYSDGFTDVLGIIMIIFGTAIYFVEPN